ncbi:MAG: hypothetical protein MI723_14485, partial [Caulobacterales bacterium]|nr:hypothetical protein [Caulobacterales bacterium]
RLEEAATRAGCTGALTVQPCENRAAGDCEITWRDGAAAIASEDTLARVEEAAARWLAAEEAAEEQFDLFAAPAGRAEGAQ